MQKQGVMWGTVANLGCWWGIPKGLLTLKKVQFLPSQSQSVKPWHKVLMQIIPFLFSFQENMYLSDGK